MIPRGGDFIGVDPGSVSPQQVDALLQPMGLAFEHADQLILQAALQGWKADSGTSGANDRLPVVGRSHTIAAEVSMPDVHHPAHTYTAVVERCPDTGFYVGYVPGFPGAHSQGATIEELSDNLKEVIAMLLDDGEPASRATSA